MNQQNEIEQILKELKPLLIKKFKVKEIGLFGSYGRGEESEESDIDILVEFSERIGWEFIDFKEYLENRLGKTIDLVTVKALRPQLRDRILKEVKYA